MLALGKGRTAVERILHILDSPGQILALAFRQKAFKLFELSLFTRQRYFLPVGTWTGVLCFKFMGSDCNTLRNLEHNDR